MRGETMKGKSKKSTYSTTFGVDPKSTYSTTFGVDPFFNAHCVNYANLKKTEKPAKANKQRLSEWKAFV